MSESGEGQGAGERTPLLSERRRAGARARGYEEEEMKAGDGCCPRGRGCRDEERAEVKEGGGWWPWTMVLTAVLAAFTPLSRGFATGYTSPSIGRFLDAGLLSEGSAAVFGSLVNLGGLLCCAIIPWALNRFGRRATLMAAALPQLAGWLCLCFARDAAALIVGRLLNGFGSAVVFSAFSIYLAEIAHRSARGALCVLGEMFISLGTMTAYLLGQVLSNQQLAAVGACLSAATFLSMIPLRRSPRWLVSRGRLAEGMEALVWLRGGRQEPADLGGGSCYSEVRQEFEAIREKLEQSGGALPGCCGAAWWRDVAVVRRALAVCGGMMLLQGMGGPVAVIAYMQTIFGRAGFTHPGWATVLVGGLRIFATGLAGVLVDRLGRRSLLMVGGVIQTACLAGLAVLFHAQSVPTGHNTTAVLNVTADMERGAETTAPPSEHWMTAALLTHGSLACVSLFLFAYSLGWGTVPSVVIAELFPQRQRALASSVTSMAGLAAGTTCAFLFPLMCAALGEAGAFAVYALVGLTGVLFVACLLPETKNRSLEELGDALASESPDDVTSQHYITVPVTSEAFAVTSEHVVTPPRVGENGRQKRFMRYV